MQLTERRQALRYRVALPVELESHETGKTRDISVSGVFFETRRSFPAGAPIRLVLMFDGVVRVQCEGQVVRVERSEENVGVAVAFTAYRFQEFAQDEYGYVWKTDKAWAGTCRQFVMMLKDGSLHSANFRFK